MVCGPHWGHSVLVPRVTLTCRISGRRRFDHHRPPVPTSSYSEVNLLCGSLTFDALNDRSIYPIIIFQGPSSSYPVPDFRPYPSLLVRSSVRLQRRSFTSLLDVRDLKGRFWSLRSSVPCLRRFGTFLVKGCGTSRCSEKSARFEPFYWEIRGTVSDREGSSQ